MKKARLFEIAYVGLKAGEHVFEYQIDNQFLDWMQYEGEPLKDLNCQVSLKFEKLTNLFQLQFDYNGTTQVACDRCGDDMELNIWDEHKLIIKLSFDEQMTEMQEEDDVIIFPRHESIIDVSKWVYEFLLLSIPIQHVHTTNEEGKSLCNPDALKILEQHQTQAKQEQRDKLWRGLDKLKNK